MNTATDMAESSPRSVLETEENLLQEDLIQYYRSCHSTIPVSPLVIDDQVPLKEFYVHPQMEAMDLQRPLGNPTKKMVTSYTSLFFRQDGYPYRNIYVTAQAGFGKTSFCKNICMAWCQAHKPLKTLSEKFKTDEISATFKFLFLITLRDVNRSLCDLDSLIKAFVDDHLRRHHKPNLLENILAESSCLVVLDGLDEWNHPESCKRTHNIDDIPHKKSRENWTILTTLRPWKFDIIRLASYEIDRHIEIKELDNESSKILVSNAVNLLNRKSEGETMKTVQDFYRTISLIKLGEIRHIPYIYLQCVCLWFDGKNIGGSKCEIYTNLVELTLIRGNKKIEPMSFPTLPETESDICLPHYMTDKPYCIQHKTLLLKLGRLAFSALFEIEQIQRLVVDFTFAMRYLERKELLEYCLKLGLLSQNKVYGPVSQRISSVSFQHKSIQEYFAALYIQANTEFSIMFETVLNKCTSLSSILDMSDVFMFLSRFKPEAYNIISHTIKNIVSADSITQKYRSTAFIRKRESEYDVIFKYQTLQVDCAHEINMSGQEHQPLPLEDIVINEKSNHEEYLSKLQTLVHKNFGSIKSLSVRKCETADKAGQILDALDLQNIISLEKLDIWVVPRQQLLENLLTKSIKTLRSLTLRFLNYKQGYTFQK